MLWKWTISYSSSFSCWFIICLPIGGKPSFSIFFSNWELKKLECVCSMYPQGVGTNASFTKICCNEGFLPSSVGQFTAHSAGWLIRNLASCTNRSVLSVQAANSSKPPPLPPSTGSRNSHNTAEQNCGRITLFEGNYYWYIFLALCQTLQQVDKYIKVWIKI